MPTEKETLYIAFSTQKGGAGKTTLTVLAASYLHYVKGLNVAVVDCDYPQHSIAEMRKRDLKTVMEDEHYKAMAYRQLQRIGKKAYPVIEGTAEDARQRMPWKRRKDYWRSCPARTSCSSTCPAR